jgi:hypothetical protein
MLINENDWSHEDLSSLKNLINFDLFAAGQNRNDPNSPLIPLDPAEIDNVLIQIAAGAGQVGVNGSINIVTGGSNRTGNSNAAYNLLTTQKGWSINIDTTTR